MAVWQNLPTDLVRRVLSQPGVACDVKVELGKDIGPLINKVQVPEGLGEKLSAIFASRTHRNVAVYGHRMRMMSQHQPQNKVSVAVFNNPRTTVYQIVVNKQRMRYIYTYIYSERKGEWIVDQTRKRIE